ncbi:MAG: polyprenyl synthetase family protein [Bombilactobacillus mellifer]|uniref:polyprenyl synthetase family protein n=1 Tax=Bombilactobacillus mellifer TaxID=1218492 RepID=UPI0023F71122|nr:polyprenyl synthetase family protein [Bombilactobacillus mellifer]MCT6894269.1 polyprenyl synthetase family protein [Bombilactobacillus mellifer]
MINSFWNRTPHLQQQLTAVQTLILHQVDQLKAPLAPLIRQQILNGGKMLRPAFLLIFSQFGPQPQEDQLIEAAAAMEILHLATLMHDDVIDNSPTRRHSATVQTQVGDRNAIYAGDYLLTVYFELIARVTTNQAQILQQARGLQKILQGELDQLQINANVNATVKMYLREIAGKTAQLIELSAQLGATLAQAEPQIIHQARFIGHNVGMAFQIQDDILDYVGDERTGKPQFEDLTNGVYTLPLIYALQTDPNGHLRQLLQTTPPLTAMQVQQIVHQVILNGGITAAQRLAHKYTHKAQALIEQLPPAHAQKLLQVLIPYLLQRQV